MTEYSSQPNKKSNSQIMGEVYLKEWSHQEYFIRNCLLQRVAPTSNVCLIQQTFTKEFFYMLFLFLLQFHVTIKHTFRKALNSNTNPNLRRREQITIDISTGLLTSRFANDSHINDRFENRIVKPNLKQRKYFSLHIFIIVKCKTMKLRT